MVEKVCCILEAKGLVVTWSYTAGFDVLKLVLYRKVEERWTLVCCESRLNKVTESFGSLSCDIDCYVWMDLLEFLDPLVFEFCSCGILVCPEFECDW